MKKGDLLLFGETAEKNKKEKTTIDGEKTGEDSVAADANLRDLLKKLSLSLGAKDESIEEISRIAGRNSLRRQIEKRAEEERKNSLYKKILGEAYRVASKYESFDLKNELSNPKFKGLIISGFSVEDAYKLIHFDELIERSRLDGQREAYEMTVAQLRCGMLRPEENGLSACGAAVEKKSVSALTGRGIREILKRVEKGAKVKF